MQHPASQPSPHLPFRRKRRVNDGIGSPGAQDYAAPDTPLGLAARQPCSAQAIPLFDEARHRRAGLRDRRAADDCRPQPLVSRLLDTQTRLDPRGTPPEVPLAVRTSPPAPEAAGLILGSGRHSPRSSPTYQPPAVYRRCTATPCPRGAHLTGRNYRSRRCRPHHTSTGQFIVEDQASVFGWWGGRRRRHRHGSGRCRLRKIRSQPVSRRRDAVACYLGRAWWEQSSPIAHIWPETTGTDRSST